MKKTVFMVALLTLIVCFTLNKTNFSSETHAEAVAFPVKNIETSDTAKKPVAEAILELGKNAAIELWHYSGGYWKYNDLTIMDSQLNGNLTNPDALAKALNKDVTFEISINSDQYRDLINRDKLKAFVSTTLPNKKYSHLFAGVPSIELKDNKVYVSMKPKFNFYYDKTFEDLIGEELNVEIPIVHPDFGYNRYSIWGRSSSVNWGAATGYFDPENIDATDPTDSGKISPSQIINDQGHLKNGFNVKTTNGEGEPSTHRSDDSSVGAGTFKSGGAVSIYFWYPISISFYDEVEDLSAEFDSLPSSAAVGEEVTVGVRVNSAFDKVVKDVPYKWLIKTISGKVVPATFTNSKLEGNIANISANGESILYANFTMPDEDVRVLFDVNKDGKSPVETFFTNNHLDSGNAIKAAKVVNSVGEFDLPYNVLTRKVRYPLADSPITAQLILPRGSWDGSASGSLKVTNNTFDLLREFKVTENPDVTESEEKIYRDPIVHSLLKRTDFDDNPQGKDWLNLTNPTISRNRDAKVSFNGNVRRSYSYSYTGPPCDLEGNCKTYSGSDTATGSFNSGTNTKTIKAYIYNGRKDITKKIFEKKIVDNSTSSNKKKMFWESEPYKYDVIRWMYNMDEDGKLYGEVAVDGQYKREFTQQATADIIWSSDRTMKQEYEKARTAAKNMTNNKGLYDKAVFATDRQLQNLANPIKSGYYFNPAGSYSFEIETVTYKDKNDDTKDHKDMVQALIDSFRYESDLMYINRDKKAVNIQGVALPSKGAGFQRVAGILTAKDPVGIDGTKLLTVIDATQEKDRYHKKVDVIKHSQNEEGETDTLWKNILEGYSESGSADSLTEFKYQEFVKDNQSMYRITEKTKVSIIINPANTKVYTHANMQNGEYSIKVWLDETDLSKSENAYKGLGILNGMEKLDLVKVDVVGSMYDDLNN